MTRKLLTDANLEAIAIDSNDRGGQDDEIVQRLIGDIKHHRHRMIDFMHLVGLRAGYILGVCKDEREMKLEAQAIENAVEKLEKELL